MRFVAPSGIAGSNLAKRSTIHHALGLPVFDGDSETLQCESDKAKLHRLRKPFEACKVLIVDEVSMVGCRMLRDIHSRLYEIMQCQDKPFGGMCVVLMGDFVQLMPVGQTELFGSVKVQVGGQDVNDVFGREYFQTFDEVSLVKQHRATDPQYAASVPAFREWTNSALQTKSKRVARDRSRKKKPRKRRTASKNKGKSFFPTSETPKNILRGCLARLQILGHSQKTKNNRVATATQLSVACPKTPSKVRVLGASDLCAPQPQRKKKKGNTRTKKNKGKQANTKHTQTTTSSPAAETQVCYILCNTMLRSQVKHDHTRTDKEYQDL